MAVTNLTGTTWVLYNNFSATAGYGEFTIDCIIDGDSFTGQVLCVGWGMVFDPMEGPTFGPLANTVTLVPSWKQWTSGGVLEITGGRDVTNQSLIAWVEANATQRGGARA